MKRAMWFLTACLAATVAMPAAHADKYAAMDEAPVKGGELRLSVEVLDSSSGTERRIVRCPLKHMNISIEVAGSMAEYSVEQVFTNPLNRPIEAVYVFPLGDEAAVNSYELVIGKRVVKGKIDTRSNARKTYRQARRSGHTAALLQQNKANVFTQRVANIPAGETIKVRFRYVELIDHKDGFNKLVFPMVVGPRYLPATRRGRNPVGSNNAGAPIVTSHTSVPYSATYKGPSVSLTARLDASVPIGTPTSPSHAIVTKAIDKTAVQVSLNGSTGVANRDFILRYRSAGAKTMVGVLAHRNAKTGYVVLNVQPKLKYRTGDIAPREVVILIDKSGSMSGVPMNTARSLGKAVVNTLTARDTFNVITFASGTASFSGGPVTADANGKARGLAWLDNIRAGGATEMERGILRSLARKPGADRVRLVYVITDGFIGNDDVILNTAQKRLGHNRIFPVGVGSAPNRYLLDRLGEDGRGFTSYILDAGQAPKVSSALVRRSAFPYLTDVRVDWGGLAVRNMTPARLPDVYAGMPLTIAAQYATPGEGTIKVHASQGGRRVVIPLKITLPAHQRNRPVAYLWARRRIKELMAKDYGTIDHKTKAAVTRLGLGFGLVTEFTSYVAVDRSRRVKNGVVETIVQPAPTPHGVNHASAVGGSSPRRARTVYNSGSSYRRSYSGGSSGGSWSSGGGKSYRGGGDTDPISVLLALLLLPMAVFVRRRWAR